MTSLAWNSFISLRIDNIYTVVVGTELLKIIVVNIVMIPVWLLIFPTSGIDSIYLCLREFLIIICIPAVCIFVDNLRVNLLSANGIQMCRLVGISRNRLIHIVNITKYIGICVIGRISHLGGISKILRLRELITAFIDVINRNTRPVCDNVAQ